MITDYHIHLCYNVSMQTLHETEEKPKKAFLVNIVTGSKSDDSIMRELRGLCKTLGLEIIAQEKVRVREKNPKYGLGTGKAEEIAQKAKDAQADLLVFDFNPNPSQQRNWETLCDLPVIDRQELIIKIFADRAVTREAELQVKLAELEYLLPRLSHKYIDLSRQRGGRYGTKGAGETKLETDRRKIEKRLRQLEKEIEQISKQRKMQRRLREKSNVPVCAIVGYTNAGKSSLLNALTGADVLAEDKLFATLDAVTRRFEVSPGVPVLLTDTVGFIRNLPHTLIKAFRSTMEEAAAADIIIHILDASEPDIESNYNTTIGVLNELKANEIPMITVLNKIDKENVNLEELINAYPESVAVSVKKGTGFDALKEKIISHIAALI